MSDEFASDTLRRALAQISGNFGFNSSSSVTFEVLSDIWSGYLGKLCTDLRKNVEQCGRLDPILDDVGLVFETNGVSLRELSDFIQQTTPSPLPTKVPKFPVRKRDYILYAKPSEKELNERPEYIPSYCPSLYSNRKDESSEAENESEDKVKYESGSQIEPAGRIRRQASTRVTDRLNRQTGSLEQGGLPDFSDFDALKAGLVTFVEPSPSPPPAPTPPLPPIIQQPIIKVSQSSTSIALTKIKIVMPPPPPSLVVRPNSPPMPHSPAKIEPVLPEEILGATVLEKDVLRIREFQAAQASLSVSIKRMTPEIIQEELLVANLKKLSPKTPQKAPIKAASKKIPKKKTYVKKPKATKKWTQESLFGETITIPSQKIPEPETVELEEVPVPEQNIRPNQAELKEKLTQSRAHYSKDKLKQRLQKRAEGKQAIKRAVEKSLKSYPPIASKVKEEPEFKESPAVPILTLKFPASRIEEPSVEERQPPVVVKPKMKKSTFALKKKLKTQKKQPAGKLISPLKIKFKAFPQAPVRKSSEDIKEIRKKKKKEKQKGKLKRKRDSITEEPQKKTLEPKTVEHTATSEPAQDKQVDEPPRKVPRLILKLGGKPTEETEPEVVEEAPVSPVPPTGPSEPLKVAPLRVTLKKDTKGFVSAPKKKSVTPEPVAPPEKLPKTEPEFTEEVTPVKFIVGSPPPKSPSLHSRSPGSEIAETASSPPPHTPSPRSNSDQDSPLRIQSDIYDDVPPRTPSAGIPNQYAPSPATKVISPAQTGSASPAISAISGAGSSVGDKEWFCPVCGVKYKEDADMIGCDNCDNWFHWACVGLLEAPPEDQNWYCNDCHPKAKKVSRSGSQASIRGRKKCISKRGKKKTK